VTVQDLTHCSEVSLLYQLH